MNNIVEIREFCFENSDNIKCRDHREKLNRLVLNKNNSYNTFIDLLSFKQYDKYCKLQRIGRLVEIETLTKSKKIIKAYNDFIIKRGQYLSVFSFSVEWSLYEACKLELVG